MNFQYKYLYRLSNGQPQIEVEGDLPVRPKNSITARIVTGQLQISFHYPARRFLKLSDEAQTRLIKMIDEKIGYKISGLSCRQDIYGVLFFTFKCVLDAKFYGDKPVLQAHHDACMKLALLQFKPKILKDIYDAIMEDLESIHSARDEEINFRRREQGRSPIRNAVKKGVMPFWSI